MHARGLVLKFTQAMQATVAKHGKKSDLPAISVTLVAAPDSIGMRISDQGTVHHIDKVCRPIRPGGGLLSPQICTPSDLFSFSHIRNASRLEQDHLRPLRTVCASPTGMRATVEELVQRWKDEWPRVEDGTALRNSSERKSGSVHRPRLGIGLAMCNIFAR